MNLVYFRPHVCFQNLIQKEASYAFYEEKKSLKFKNFFGTHAALTLRYQKYGESALQLCVILLQCDPGHAAKIQGKKSHSKLFIWRWVSKICRGWTFSECISDLFCQCTIYFAFQSVNFKKIGEVWKDFFLLLNLGPTVSFQLEAFRNGGLKKAILEMIVVTFLHF